MAVVLDEVVDEDYEPSQQEIDEYAEWLGMDPAEDVGLMWIAREGLKAPLPGAWKPCQTAEGEIFYFNFETGDSVWDHPSDEHYRRIYRRHKAKQDAPVLLVTICGSLEEDANELIVHCCGSLNGEEIAVLNIKPTLKVRQFRSVLAKRVEASRRRLRIVFPDGRLLTDEDDRLCLAEVLGIDCSPIDENGPSKESQRRLKKELKKTWLHEHLDRCHILGGLGHGPSPVPADPEQQDIHPEMSLMTSADNEAQTGNANVELPASELSSARTSDATAADLADDLFSTRRPASEDSGLLKSVLVNHGESTIHRQRPQSLRLRPISKNVPLKHNDEQLPREPCDRACGGSARSSPVPDARDLTPKKTPTFKRRMSA